MSIIKHGRSETSPLASPAAFDLQGRRDLATWLFIVGSGWISGAEAWHSKVFPFLQARRYSSWQEAGICLLRRNPVKVNPNWTPSSRCAETPWSLTHGHAHIKPPPPSRSHAPMSTFQMAKLSCCFFFLFLKERSLWLSDCINSHVLTQIVRVDKHILTWMNDAKQNLLCNMAQSVVRELKRVSETCTLFWLDQIILPPNFTNFRNFVVDSNHSVIF